MLSHDADNQRELRILVMYQAEYIENSANKYKK